MAAGLWLAGRNDLSGNPDAVPAPVNSQLEDAITDSIPSDPLSLPNAAFSQEYVEVDEGVELLLRGWLPDSPRVAAPLFFIAGWVSVIEGWADLLRALVPTRPVYYVETREKRSARIASDRMDASNFSIPRLGSDLTAIWEHIGFRHQEADLFGSSMGSNAILEALKHGRLPARSAFLVGPNSEFVFPWWSWTILAMPTGVYPALRGFVMWYLRNFRVDARSEPEQMRRYERTLRAAHPLRLKRSALAVKSYTAWNRLETIEAPVGFAYAPSDKLHDERAIQQMAATVPRGETVLCESNTYMHTAAVMKELDEFIERVAG